MAESFDGITDTIHAVPVSEVYASLSTQSRGLTENEAGTRLQQIGRNALREVKGKPLYLKFLANFNHVMAILLWTGGFAAFFARMPQLGVAVWMVNIINGSFSFWQEYRAEKATEALTRLLPTYSRVLRDGEEKRVLAEDLVPGDVILLAEGDRVSADARLVKDAELRLDQSTLTGESRPVRKSSDVIQGKSLTRAELPNLVFAGTTVASGTGKAVVFATGMQTQFGKIANLTQSVGDELSPLQKEMSTVTKVVTMLAVAVGVVFFLLSVLLAGITVTESFIFAIGMIVAFVPEGLLPTVTLALAMGTQRMARRQALIKKLSAVETLGCTTVICTDKTGTLTQNEMTVRELWVGGVRLIVTGTGYEPNGQVVKSDGAYAQDDLAQLLRAAALCNNARLLAPKAESSRWEILGDPTEAALKVVAVKSGLELEAEERFLPRWRELPFDSRRKRMSTVHMLDGSQVEHSKFLFSEPAHSNPKSGTIVFTKGAPKEIMDLCTHIQLNGSESSLDANWRQQIISANDDYARNGLRVLAIAHKVAHFSAVTPFSAEAVEKDLVFLGLIAMMDPPRPEVAAAVAKCHTAGIRVVMITGDYGLTAESIARKIGILRSARPRIISGVELDTMDNASLKEALKSEVVFARAAPEHKLRVVSVMQELGHVVAVTGDGVNDAPALKKADIGVAMGIVGTDVAKEAADMILMDDNFASIVHAVEEGRAVYANIKKFTTYIFTSNAPEAVPFIIFALSAARIPLALNVMHVLAIDLGTDIVPALALGAELPELGAMDHPPRNLNEHVVTRSLLIRAYVWLGLPQALAAMAAFYFMYWTNGYWGKWIDLPSSGDLYRAATAMALAAVVTTQVGNLFAQRSEYISVFRLSLFSNHLLWVGIATELILVFMITYVPLFQDFIGTAAFPLSNWLFLFAWTPALLIVDELRKWLLRQRSGIKGF